MIGTNRSVVASAKQIQLDNRSMKRVGEEWQDALWNIYENLGAVHYGMNFKRASAQRVSYFVAEVPTEDVDEPIPTDDSAANDALDRLGDVGEIVGELVIHQNVAGEGYLWGHSDDDGEEFEVLSTIEVNAMRQPGTKGRKITSDDFLLRIWRPSPRKNSDPDSPLRSVAAQCEQLLLLNDQIGATAMSHLPAGLLAVASEFSFTPVGEPTGDDEFVTELIEYLTTAVRDPGSAARIAPGVLRGPYEYVKDGIRLIEFGRDLDATFAAMREELLRQIANGIDLPAEILTGLADLNHWSLWGIDESTAKHHVDPDILQVLNGLTTGYLRPALDEAGVDGSRFMIWRDYSDLTSRPLSVEQAERFFDKGVITADQLRRIAAVSDDDEVVGPGDIAARAEAVGVLFRAGFEPEAILEALGLPPLAHSGVAPVTVQSEQAVDDTPDLPASPDNVAPGPPPLTASGATSLSRLAAIDQALAAQIIEATEAACARALERAGAKIRTQVKKDRQVSALIDGVDNSEVTLLLGAERLERFQLTPDQLVPGDTFALLQDRVDRLLRNAQTRVDEEVSTYFEPEFTEVEESRTSAVAAFIAALFGIITARLFTSAPEEDPGELSDSVASGQLVYELLTAAGGAPVAGFSTDTARGFALGARVRAAFREHGYVTESYTWQYGIAPRRTFEPHLALDGLTVLDLESPELLVSPVYSWLGVSHYFPGDHKGCLCAWVPSVLPTDGVG